VNGIQPKHMLPVDAGAPTPEANTATTGEGPTDTMAPGGFAELLHRVQGDGPAPTKDGATPAGTAASGATKKPIDKKAPTVPTGASSPDASVLLAAAGLAASPPMPAAVPDAAGSDAVSAAGSMDGSTGPTQAGGSTETAAEPNVNETAPKAEASLSLATDAGAGTTSVVFTGRQAGPGAEDEITASSPKTSVKTSEPDKKMAAAAVQTKPAGDRQVAITSERVTIRPRAQAPDAAAPDKGDTPRPSAHAIAAHEDASIVLPPTGMQPPALTAAMPGMAGKVGGTDTPAAVDPAEASDAVTKLRLGSPTKVAPTRTSSSGGSDGNETPPILAPDRAGTSDRFETAGAGAPTMTARASALDAPDPVDPAATPGQHRADLTIGDGDQRIVVSILASEHQVRVHARTATGDDTAAMRAGADELRGALRKHGLELAYLNAETKGGGTTTERGPQRDTQENRQPSQERRATESRDPAESPRSDVRVLA
jgi:hypothetical protein